ncbi:radical SAM protein [Vitiosangium sp. GDMCC 1.1324]|uniref:radical SAM/SPASM domain-containing protein n=1 Tax=Vitiosangium sp. (strain GDMCC 1.1324) TaxID=2138576 RepID=UPI000D39E2E7|nr:radical SAM protein [Vitiosangium sp. GDMCC 1.1324]PTL84281.1 radical SAM protein [Vitiosangium sp. GDMCC 1.1324]
MSSPSEVLGGPPASSQARRLFALSAPHVPDVHLFQTELGRHLLVVNGSRLFDVDAEVSEALDRARLVRDGGAVQRLLEELGVSDAPFIDDQPVESPPVRALSLAVAQKCNLGCTYCYAQQGDFGGPARNMPLQTALDSVELLLRDVGRGERVNLSFLGGEPLFNRAVIRAATERAVERAREKGVSLTLSLTTNGTLLNADDASFLEEHGFAVTVSLDGRQEVHDRLRAFKGGQGSFARVMENVAPLLARQRRMQVSARVTVTPQNLELRETLDAFVGLGFHSVGFSPMLSSPTGRDELGSAELELMLEQMVDCGREFERRLIAGQRYPFSNMVNAMRELHKGTHRPYPCGAGAGYLGVSASGELAACHRFVGDEEGAMGDLRTGVDRERQARWLTERHVHRQEPCRSCWARYMCSGGCHHEVIQRGRPACDYIRGWLHYCLEAYSRLSQARPDYFGLAPAAG